MSQIGLILYSLCFPHGRIYNSVNVLENFIISNLTVTSFMFSADWHCHVFAAHARRGDKVAEGPCV